MSALEPSEIGRLAEEPARLARLGFADGRGAARLVAELAPALADNDTLEALSETADPDQALRSLVAIGAGEDPAALAEALHHHEGFADQLLSVLGVSAALGDHLARHPGDWRCLTGEQSAPSAELLKQELCAAVDGHTGPAALDELRIAYRRRLLRLAARDLTGAADLAETAAELADLAAAALQAALRIAVSELPPGAPPCRLAIIGMGKCGGRELNYVSDVDVVFVAEHAGDGDEPAASRTATRLASAVMRICSQQTAEGSLWEVDAALRPEGKAGPLVRTLASHVAYYERWAKTWEFQALLKARPVAGDAELGEQYVAALSPMVWRAAEREGFVDEVQQMRRRVEAHVAPQDADRQLKLGPGGLRDVEFAVQLLQLVHGRADDTLRSASTLEALAALAEGGYIGRDDAARLGRAYRFLRTLEHRIQLHRLRRTHVMPTNDADLRRLGRSLGFRTNPVVQLSERWRLHAREVRRIHEKLFYRPLLNAVARLATDEARLTPEAARTRLEALGYADPSGALHHLEALTSGVSRAAAIQRTLLPVMLGWFADSADPDGGLLGFRQVSEALGTTHWYLRLLRDEGATAERMAHLLGSGRYAIDLLLRAPEAVALLADDSELRPRERDALATEVLAAVRRHDDPTAATSAARAVRRRELFRVAAADLSGLLTIDDVGGALSDIAAATLHGGFEAAVRAVEAERREALPTRIAIIAMGRLGGHELGYGSDADVLFVHDPREGADERAAHAAAHDVANELRRLLSLPAPDPPLLVDADLRPEGRQGPLVRTFASYEAYYARWAQVWESQALLRAEPVAGDERLGQRFTYLIDPMRWPARGIDEASAREIRRIKARVEAERLPRGADPSTHLKLGPGGLADVEWSVQLLQLRYGARVPQLRTTRTLPALAAATDADLLAVEDAEILHHAWLTATRLRNAMMLLRARPADSLPRDIRDLDALARMVGYPPGSVGALVDDWRRTARRARAVVERVFYA